MAGVLIDGSDARDVDVMLDSTFEPVPIAQAVGVPLFVKGDEYAPLTSKYYGTSCRRSSAVVAARADGVPFGSSDWDTFFRFVRSFVGDTDFSESLQNRARHEFTVFLRTCHDKSTFLDIQYPRGVQVVACGLQTSLNGVVGCVCGYERGVVGVEFPEPWGVKLMKLENLEFATPGIAELSQGKVAQSGSKVKPWKALGLFSRSHKNLVASKYPLTDWEFGIAPCSEEGKAVICSTRPLHHSIASKGHIVAWSVGVNSDSDWLDCESQSLTTLVYVTFPAELCTKSVEGFLFDGCCQSNHIHDPQANLHPSRTVLMVRPLSRPWVVVGTVAMLNRILQLHPRSTMSMLCNGLSVKMVGMVRVGLRRHCVGWLFVMQGIRLR